MISSVELLAPSKSILLEKSDEYLSFEFFNIGEESVVLVNDSDGLSLMYDVLDQVSVVSLTGRSRYRDSTQLSQGCDQCTFNHSDSNPYNDLPCRSIPLVSV